MTANVMGSIYLRNTFWALYRFENEMAYFVKYLNRLDQKYAFNFILLTQWIELNIRYKVGY